MLAPGSVDRVDYSTVNIVYTSLPPSFPPSIPLPPSLHPFQVANAWYKIASRESHLLDQWSRNDLAAREDLQHNT